MADILRDLLLAYYQDLQEQRDQGNLPYLRSHYLVQSPQMVPQDLSAELPTILIWHSGSTAQVQSLPGCSSEKRHSITLSIYCEGYGDETLGLLGNDHYTGVLEMAEDIEALYRSNTFDGLSMFCSVVAIDSTMRRVPPFLHEGINQMHLTFQHLHVDMWNL